jgi:hypothetical protein
MQLLEEALQPLSKEKDSLLQEYNASKRRFDQEYDRLAERKRNFQQEHDALGRLNMKIKEYNTFFPFLGLSLIHDLLLVCNSNAFSGTWIQRKW